MPAKTTRLLLVLVLFLFLSGSAQAQEPIYLPLIFKGLCNMPAILEISDGTTTINLLPKEATGFHLVSWTPEVAALKGGGIYQESAMSAGQSLVYAQYENINDAFNFVVDGRGQDETIDKIERLIQLLLLGRNYRLADWQDTPVYIRGQASCETGIRYALIENFSIPDLNNPYAQPFASASQLASMADFSVIIEHGHWLASAPGTGESVTATNSQEWDYSEGWTVYDSLGAVPDLPAPSGAYRAMAIGNDRILVAHSNLFAGSGDSYISTDKGSTWAAVTDGGSVSIRDILKISNSNILLSDEDNGFRILRSTDQGSSFSVLSTAVGGGPLVQFANGHLLTIYNGDDIYRSTDQGANWTKISDFGGAVTAAALMISPTTDTVIAYVVSAVWERLYRSTDRGETWSLVKNLGTSYFYDDAQPMIADSNGNFYTLSIVGDLWRSADDGITWLQLYSNLDGLGYAMFEDSYGHIWAILANGTMYLYRSVDGGLTFTKEETINENGFDPTSMTESGDGDYYIGGAQAASGDGGLVYRLASIQDFGWTTEEKLYVTNRQNKAQLTHIFVDDGGVFGSNQFPVTAAFLLTPAVAATGDAVYFGIDTTIDNTGPFSGLGFYITDPAAAVTSYAFTWEYYNGAWDPLTVQDNTDDGLGSFSKPGYGTVHWEQPSDWVTVAVNSVTGYWVRARLSSLTGAFNEPQQGNTDLLTLILPFTEIDSNQVGGSIPALMQLKAYNLSDADGRDGSAPDLFENRVVVGLRSTSRGSKFQSYINLSDEQNPVEIDITAGTNTSFADDVLAPSGRRMSYTPGAGAESMATRATVTLNPVIAKDFYGIFHAFLRVQRTGGAASNLDIQLKITSGSGGISFTTDMEQVQTTTAFEVLDFGQILLPVAGSLKNTELGDQTTIDIQVSAEAGAPDLYLYDLILMPADEWLIDATDKANEDDSDVGRNNDIPRLLDIDSITYPKESIRALVRQISNEVTATYRAGTISEAILQANAQQRLWFFAMQTSATGSSFNWIAPPEISHSVVINKVERFLQMRGAS